MDLEHYTPKMWGWVCNHCRLFTAKGRSPVHDVNCPMHGMEEIG